jgi:hypothetical protein
MDLSAGHAEPEAIAKMREGPVFAHDLAVFISTRNRRGILVC